MVYKDKHKISPPST